MRPDYRTLGLTVPVSEALDPKLWRERYAFGINLGPANGPFVSVTERLARAKQRVTDGCCGEVPQDQLDDLVTQIPDDVIRWHLRAALSELEIKLGVPMGIQVVKSEPIDEGSGPFHDKTIGRLPYTHGESIAWFRVDLPDNNIISVERIRGFYYGTQVWEISPQANNADLIRVEWKRPGTLHILPVNLQSIMVTQGGNYGIWHTIHMHRSPIPDFWAIDYTCGPVARNGEVGKIEAVLAHWVYCVAGITILSMGGLSQTKGLTSTSIGIDGVSRSIGLQAAGVNSALENVLKEAEKRIDWKALRTAKRALRMKMYSY